MTVLRRLAAIAIAPLAVLAIVGLAAADSTVVVSPANLNGWIVDTTVLGNPPVPTTFNGASDSAGGNGSFRFGPIGGVNGAKLEIQPPDVNVLVSDFGGLSYEFQVLASVAGVSANHFYANVYVDSSANGIGFFGSGVVSSGFYDCRYGYVPQVGGGTWTLFGFDASTVPSGIASRHPSCSATLAGLPAGSTILFFRLNGGDTSANDNGLEGAYDLVAITVAGDTTTYDFEPYLVADSKDDCKGGGWSVLARDDGSPFKNQGDCIQYTNTGK